MSEMAEGFKVNPRDFVPWSVVLEDPVQEAGEASPFRFQSLGAELQKLQYCTDHNSRDCRESLPRFRLCAPPGPLRGNVRAMCSPHGCAAGAAPPPVVSP